MVVQGKFNQPEMPFVPKGWGYELHIVNKESYCGKILHFIKNKRCSVHFHKKKDETFFLSKGKIQIYWTDDVKKLEVTLKSRNLYGKKWYDANGYLDYLESFTLNEGDNFYVPPGRAHQMIALEQSELFEFSTQDFPDDSFRAVLGD